MRSSHLPIVRRRVFVVLALLLVVLSVALRPAWLNTVWQVVTTDSISALAAYLRSFGVWTPLVSLLLMVLQAVIAPLPGSLVAVANSLVFGIWWGALLSWAGGMLGATASFWIARWLGRDVAARLAGRTLGAYSELLGQSDGFWLIITLRLIPVVSFDLISYGAGLSRISYKRFMLATAAGMLPGTLAWTILAHDLAYAQTSAWRVSLVVLFVLLSVAGGRWWLRQRARLRLSGES